MDSTPVVRNGLPDRSELSIGPWMKTVSPDTACAASASATPILPDDAFDMYRTGSIHSRVGPPVTMIFLSLKDIDGSPVDGLDLGEFSVSEIAAGHRPLGGLDKPNSP